MNQRCESLKRPSASTSDDIQEPDEATLLVHCYAGIGRTGTFITALLLKYLIENSSLGDNEHPSEWLEKNLVDIVLKMREERSPRFVQTKEQFKLLLELGQEWMREK